MQDNKFFIWQRVIVNYK